MNKKMLIRFYVGGIITIMISIITFISGSLASASFNILYWTQDVRESTAIAYGIANFIGWVVASMYETK